MKTKLIATILVLLIFLANSAIIAPAQDARRAPLPPDEAWAALIAVARDEKLLAQLKNNEMIEGRFLSVTETTIVLYRGQTTRTIERADVQRVYSLSGRARSNSALVGAGVGAAAGVGVGAGVYLPSRDSASGATIPLFGAIGAGIGALIGALTGNNQRRVLLYDAGAVSSIPALS